MSARRRHWSNRTRTAMLSFAAQLGIVASWPLATIAPSVALVLLEVALAVPASAMAVAIGKAGGSRVHGWRGPLAGAAGGATTALLLAAVVPSVQVRAVLPAALVCSAVLAVIQPRSRVLAAGWHGIDLVAQASGAVVLCATLLVSSPGPMGVLWAMAAGEWITFLTLSLAAGRQHARGHFDPLAAAGPHSAVAWMFLGALVVLASMPAGPVVSAPVALATGAAGLWLAQRRGPFSGGYTLPVRRARRRRDLVPVPAEVRDIDRVTDITVVLPAFNPGPALARTAEAVRDRLWESGRRVEVIVVGDGCTDGSLEPVRDMPGVRVIEHSPNRGKGYAVRRGMRAASGPVVAFIDADGDIDPAVLPRLCDALEQQPDAWAAVADRFQRDSDSAEGFTRGIAHLGFAVLTASAFGLDVLDTQCGAKAFRRHRLERILPLCVQDGFVFDVELLALGTAHELGRVEPVPVRIARGATSTVTVGTAVRMALQIGRLWRTMGTRRSTRRALAPTPALVAAGHEAA